MLLSNIISYDFWCFGRFILHFTTNIIKTCSFTFVLAALEVVSVPEIAIVGVIIKHLGLLF